VGPLTMGALFAFPPAADADLPPARHAYARNRAEVRGLENERAKQTGMRSRLEAQLATYENAGAEVDRLLDQGAQSLLNKLRAGFDPVLSTLGGRAADLDARRAASAHSAEIIRRAIAAIDVEIERLEGKLADLAARKSDLIMAVIREAAEGLYVDYAQTLDDLRTSLVRLSALERLLAPPRHDHAPESRIVLTVPDFVWSDTAAETVILAPAREIQMAQKVFAALALELESNTMASLGEFPPIDPNEDPDLPYHARSAVERAQITRDTVHTNHQRLETPETRSLAAQALGAARSALGL
jgi:hypothetical protein